MAYPVSIDTFTATAPTEVLGLASGGLGISTDINNLQTSVSALETKVGVDSSAVATTIDYLLKNTASVDPGHKHNAATGAQNKTFPTGTIVGTTDTQTLTNKTLTTPIIASISNTGTVTLPTATDTLVGRATTDTLTNKRVTKRVLSAASYTTDTGTSLNCDNLDWFIVTAQAGALKLNNPTGTPTDGQLLGVAITGTAARALTYDTQFEASTVALPTTTVTTARLNMLFVWRADTSKWTILAAV